MRAFIICKNEEANVERCICALHAAGLAVTLVDSGSTDRTLEIARRLGASVQPHVYESHCQTYNLLTSRLPPDDACVIVDADMVVSPQLTAAIEAALATGAQAVRAPVRMVWAGRSLRHASLYPPKPLAFRGGRSYFVPYGHGERLASDVEVSEVTAELVHDDRKPYATFLLNQLRYAHAVQTRLRAGTVSWKDRVRATSPLLVVAQPLVSYVLRRGFLDGRGGVIYALDRLIAEAIVFREALAGEQPSKPATTTPGSRRDE
jgi:Glycosyl transferase family 2